MMKVRRGTDLNNQRLAQTQGIVWSSELSNKGVWGQACDIAIQETA